MPKEQEDEQHETEKESSVGSGRLFVEWLLTGTVFFLIALTIRVGIINPDWGGVGFNPWRDFWSMVVMSPVGWLLHGCLFGPTWVSLLSLFLVMRFRKREFLVLTAVASLVFGWMWPNIFWGMMSV